MSIRWALRLECLFWRTEESECLINWAEALFVLYELRYQTVYLDDPDIYSDELMGQIVFLDEAEEPGYLLDVLRDQNIYLDELRDVLDELKGQAAHLGDPRGQDIYSDELLGQVDSLDELRGQAVY